MSCLFCCSFSEIVLFFIFIIGIIKIYNNVTKGIHKGNERLEGKTVVVTGASAGIGAECAKDFARRGAKVIMLCRDVSKGEKIRQDIMAYSGNKNISIKQIDFASLASIRKCANEIVAEESRIDVLLNNAGAGGLGLNRLTKDGLEVLMQTNHFGPFLLTNILLGKIKQSSPGRIVNVSSIIHKYAKLDLNDLEQRTNKYQHITYANSKLCNNLFTLALAEKLKAADITANCLHPGAVKTEIMRHSGFLFRNITNIILNFLFKTTWEGAQTSIYLCVSPSVQNITGKYFSDCRETHEGGMYGPTKESHDMGVANRLWELSEKAVGLQSSEKHY